MSNIFTTARDNWNMLNECIKMSWEHIVGNKMRSFLTALGIIIGITAVIALITIVEGITGEMMSTFDEMGAGTITVQATGSVLKSGLNDDDIEKIKGIDNVKGVSAGVNGSSAIVKDGTVLDTVTVQGKNEYYFAQNDDVIVAGRALTKLDMNESSYVCIIDEDIQQAVFQGTNPVGSSIKIAGHTYQIVGVSEVDDSISGAFGGSSDVDGQVMIPYPNAMRILGLSSVNSLEVYAEDSDMMDETVASLEATLDEIFNYKDDTYNVISMDSMLESLESMKSMLTMMLAGIASISLIVGGIGIMNMMLVSVSERTKEIGLRKALGAEPEQIQLQFVVESIFLSLIGGIVGIILGLLIAWIASIFIGNAFAVVPYAILLGVGFSAAVGIGFGWGPSKSASKLNPIDALRSE